MSDRSHNNEAGEPLSSDEEGTQSTTTTTAHSDEHGGIDRQIDTPHDNATTPAVTSTTSVTTGTTLTQNNTATQGGPVPARQPPGTLESGELLHNSPNDEAYHVTDGGHDIPTPTHLSHAPGGGNTSGTPAGVTLMTNNPNDERIEVSDAEAVPTPRASSVVTDVAGSEDKTVGRQMLVNQPHDEVIAVPENADNRIRTPANLKPSTRRTGGLGGTRSGGAMVPQDEDDDDDDDNNNNSNTNDEPHEDEDEEDDNNDPNGEAEYRAEGYAGQRPEALDVSGTTGAAAGGEGSADATQVLLSKLEYDPARYAKVNATASRELQDLFRHILDYKPIIAQLPAKLRPFIPDYIPAVGDLDPFVKVPRPDGRPDGLGLYVVDEPTIPQSNPAVVQLELRATNARAMGGAAQVVDSFEDAANRPEVIDRWISDVKKVHYKKPLPTVTYQKPMPEIENLMQVWPQTFEDVLNSDLPLPPVNIDLDMDQYVRTLCAILDIPTYNSLIDSLHVMFTLYEEFRSNQHFQHE